MANHTFEAPQIPTFDKHKYRRYLWGWFSYAFARCAYTSFTTSYYLLIPLASEVFVIVSLTLFLPICLEQFARYAPLALALGALTGGTCWYKLVSWILSHQMCPACDTLPIAP